MKKIFIPLAIIVTLVAAGAGVTRLTGFWAVPSEQGDISLNVPPKTVPTNSDKKPDHKNPDVSRPANTTDSLTPSATVIVRVNNDLPPEQQDRTVYSWWFKSNNEHTSPEFDSKELTMVSGKGLYMGAQDNKKVYLTLDEGYENGYTPEILDILKTNGVKVAFFVTADYVQKQPKLIRRMVADGHLVGNHTATHPSLPKLTDAEIRQEIKVTHDMVRQLTGQDMNLMRPSMGEYNSRVIDEINDLGYTPVFWSLAYRDWEVDKQPGREVALYHVLDHLHPGAIILLHAVSKSNTEALDEIIKAVKAKGYSFASLDELKKSN